MDETNISLETNGGMFSYRVGAIILSSSNILMAKNSKEPYFYTVGGRVQFGETAEEAILREAFEETKIEFEIERLAFIHENFFAWEIESKLIHEIAFFYLMKQNSQMTNFECHTFDETYDEVTLNWLPLSGLENIQMYPDFLKTELQCLPANIGHFVSRNGITSRAR